MFPTINTVEELSAKSGLSLDQLRKAAEYNRGELATDDAYECAGLLRLAIRDRQLHLSQFVRDYVCTNVAPATFF